MMTSERCEATEPPAAATAIAGQDSDSLSRIDYDLHGLVGIRLLNASPCDAAAVSRQLGPIQRPLTREPDILIRFVDSLRISSRVRFLGLDDAGFTDDAFLVMHSRNGSRARVRIALEQIGKRCEITCESGVERVPLLIAILNLTALSKGVLPLHASAFSYDGVGVLTLGWSKGGKTETLLAFMSEGATYIGDEWIYIGADGRFMYGIPQPIRVWDWHLHCLPEYRSLLGKSDRMRLRAIKAFLSIARKMPRGTGNGSAPPAALDRLIPLLRRQLYVDMPPNRLVNGDLGSLKGAIDRLFFVVSHEQPDVTLKPIEVREIARRMVFSLQYERLDFMSCYQKFRFAFPDAKNDLIEQAEDLQREMLMRMLADKRAYVVYHPYPVPLSALFDAIRPFVND